MQDGADDAPDIFAAILDPNNVELAFDNPDTSEKKPIIEPIEGKCYTTLRFESFSFSHNLFRGLYFAVDFGDEDGSEGNLSVMSDDDKDPSSNIGAVYKGDTD